MKNKGRNKVKRILLMIMLVVLVIWAAPLAARDIKPGPDSGAVSSPDGGIKPEPGSDYTIGPGDVLDISIWKDEALTRSLLVLPDGTIAFPLIGILKAGGKTLPELKKEIEEKITRYVTDPVLSAEVRQVNSMIVYVIGRVNNPGRFVLNANINVLQALAMAGGLNPFAKKGDIKVFRQRGDKTEIFPFDYDDVVKGSRLKDNIQLNRGDVVVVP